MVVENKCIKYYFDSKTYSIQEIQENIEENKKEFPNKIIETEISINPYGMYVVNLYFKNKNNILKIIKTKKKKSIRKITTKSKEQIRLEKYCGKDKYGQYKSTGIYKPY